LRYDAIAVLTNTAQRRVLRRQATGGHPERLFDLAADEIRHAPRRSGGTSDEVLCRRSPYDYDNGDYQRASTRCSCADYGALRTEQQRRQMPANPAFGTLAN
jgi:hypothetical protein